MSDYFAGEIRIGGNVPADLLEEFLGELESSGAKVGGYDGAAFACRTADELRQAVDENGHLFLVDDQARFGMFEELEGFLCEHDIPYDRHSDARFEFDAENVRFRPGMERPLTVPSNDAGDDLADAGMIRPIAKELARLASDQADEGQADGGGPGGERETERGPAARGRAAAAASGGLIGRTGGRNVLTDSLVYGWDKESQRKDDGREKTSGQVSRVWA